MKNKKGLFIRFSEKASSWMGKPVCFVLAVTAVIVWAVTGPFFDYSDTWQLIINTSTTIITFLMVFLIQNTQNRDSIATQLKLDELIRATKGAHTVLLDFEELSEEELDRFHQQYEKIAAEARKRLDQGKKDTDIPAIILNRKV